MTRFWFPPIPLGRIAALRVLAYAFIPVDVLLTTSWVADHARTPSLFHEPLTIARVLHLPALHGHTITVAAVLLLVAAAVAVTGRAPRVAGAAVAVLYLQWMLVAFSYGKVDHDRFGFLVLLAVLPTVGRARFRDPTPDAAAGWAVRCTQVACVLTYFLAAWAKLRFGGIEWVDSATLLRAVVRRGTALGDVLADAPWTLHAAQYAIVLAELASPVLLAPGRLGRVAVVVAYAFHVAVFATVTIVFLPHLVAMAAFLPLEQVRRRPRSATAAAPRTSSPAPRHPSR